MEAPYSGPYKVTQRTNKFFSIQTSSGEEIQVSIDRLKPVYVRTNDSKVKNIAKPNDNCKTLESNSKVPTDCDNSVHVPENIPSTRTSRSGRKVLFRKENDFFYF